MVPRQLKILIINHEFPPAGGGAASACANLAKCLVQFKKWDVEITTSRLRNYNKFESRDGYGVTRVLGLRKSLHSGKIFEVILFIVHGVFYLGRNIKYKRPDIVYAFFSIPAGVLALFIKKFRNIPYYIFLRGIDVPGFYGGRFSFLNRILEPVTKYVCLNAEKIITNSESLKNLANKALPNCVIYVIPNAIDPIFSPLKTKKNNFIIKIIYVGRLNKQKAVDDLLDAFALLNNDNNSPNVFLEIIGDGLEKNNLMKKAVALNISEKIEFTGWVSRDILVDKYKKADILASPSLDEGMPNVIVEAMACGLPIIASDIPAHKELLEHNKNGILFQKGNIKALANCLDILIDDKALRKKIGKENIKKSSLYSYQNISKYL